MNKHNVLHCVALALGLTVALAGAAQAGDFDDAHPDLKAMQLGSPSAAAATPSQAAAQRVVVAAEALKRGPRDRVSTEESRAMVGEDSGSFWMTQQGAQPGASGAVAKAGADVR